MPIRPGSEDLPSPTVADAPLGRFRERVAALIALAVVAAALALLFLGFGHIADAEKFGRSKDLLLIINPVLGVVIGYYFNKVSTEARAENAESTARHATADLRKASEERQRAQELAGTARAEANQAVASLDDVSQAAERVLAEKPARSAGSLSASEGSASSDDPRRDLEAALARAKRWGGVSIQ